jgi:hypothetical protein
MINGVMEGIEEAEYWKSYILLLKLFNKIFFFFGNYVTNPAHPSRLSSLSVPAYTVIYSHVNIILLESWKFILYNFYLNTRIGNFE